jgi:hypothetical protein
MRVISDKNERLRIFHPFILSHIYGGLADFITHLFEHDPRQHGIGDDRNGLQGMSFSICFVHGRRREHGIRVGFMGDGLGAQLALWRHYSLLERHCSSAGVSVRVQTWSTPSGDTSDAGAMP